MQQSTLNYLADIVAAQGNKVFTTRPEQHSSSILKKGPAVEWIEEVYKDLGGKGNCWNIPFGLPDGIETEQVRLSLDNSLQFNRYRSVTFHSPLYEKYDPAWLSGYRRNCRTMEKECLKDGVRRGLWTNPAAESHFGSAQEAGDFFGAGSPGWKLNAFSDFLADVFLFQIPLKHKRISEYERLMLQGKLTPLNQLLVSRSEGSQLYLVKYLSRQLEITAQNSPAEG